jgi:8-oxo-dGTP pyrophosphatase MutT (NUDIX family)
MAQELSRTLSGRTLDHTAVKNNIIESAGALIRASDTGRYLFLLRNGVKFNGVWSIPGGKLDHNESVIAGLSRELSEEINFDIVKSKCIPLETYTSQDHCFVYHTFLIIVGQEFVPDLNYEHRAWCWCHIEDVPRPVHPGLFKTFRVDEINEKLKTVESLFN